MKDVVSVRRCVWIFVSEEDMVFGLAGGGKGGETQRDGGARAVRSERRKQSWKGYIPGCCEEGYIYPRGEKVMERRNMALHVLTS